MYFQIIEETSTFTQSNKFVIWLAIKTLANFNLDLLLTEYCKKKLESWVKNKNTCINSHILTWRTEMTDLTESTRLRLSTDWTVNTKSSFTRSPYILSSSPISPLLLHFFSATFVSLSILCNNCSLFCLRLPSQSSVVLTYTIFLSQCSF